MAIVRDFTGAEPRLARKTQKKQDWIRGDPNWVKFVALVPFVQVSTFAYVPVVSGGSVVMPTPFIWGLAAMVPTLVSGGASVIVPRSDAALTGYIPDVGQGLLINVPMASTIALAAIAPTVSAGAIVVVPAPAVVELVCYAPVFLAGAQVSIPMAQMGHEGYVPQIRQDYPYRVIIPSQLAIIVAAIIPVVSSGAVVLISGPGQITTLGYVPAVIGSAFAGGDCVQLTHLDVSSTPAIGVGVSAGSGNSSESIITSGQKFGAGCLQITSSAGYWRYNAQTQWQLPNGTDFTIDLWAYPTSAPAAGVERNIWRYDSAGGATRLTISQLGATGVRFHFGGTNYDFTGAGFALNTWAHLACTRVGTTVYMFKDGVLLGTRTSDTVAYAPASSHPRFGNGFIGRFDEFRLRKGTGEWTATFTPPSSAYI
jgi:hypothetical protein